MSTGGLIGIGILVFVLLLVISLILWIIAIYNKLVSKRNGVEASWANIEVLLKQRFDMIPNLVNTVKGYAKHEAETLENVINARNSAINAGGSPQDEMAASNMLTGALKSIFALSEAYPDLKANQNFISLQNQLQVMEDKISYNRTSYNNVVQEYNTVIQSVPDNFVAKMFKFEKKNLFETPAEEQAAPVVSFE